MLSADGPALVDAARAWARLRVLHLNFRTWHAEGPVPAADMLVQLATVCPRLEELVLPYLGPPAGDAPPKAWSGPPHGLRRLFVADDRMRRVPDDETLEKMTDMIGTVFPLLDLSFRAVIWHRGMMWTTVFDRLRERHQLA